MLATLPRDRWGALGLNPGTDKGTICSAAIVLPSSGEIRLNADGVSGLSVDLLDERFQPIAGFSGGRVAGSDGLDCSVYWDGHALGELEGALVRVQIEIRRSGDEMPRVYAMYV